MGAFEIETTSSGHRVQVTVPNELGLHLRPSSQLVKLASEFEGCEITIAKDGPPVDAKSIMGVIMLAAEKGSCLTIKAHGEESEQAVTALARLIEGGFGE